MQFLNSSYTWWHFQNYQSGRFQAQRYKGDKKGPELWKVQPDIPKQ